jgi:hypothetical protein
MISAAARSAWWPAHRAAAEDVSVGMRDRLPGVRPGVEDHAVAVSGDPLGQRHLMGVGDDVGQQSVTRRPELGQGGVVGPRDHQDVDGRLRVDVTEGDRPRSSRHDGRRDVASGNAAEQTVGHVPDLNVWASR